MDEQTDNRQSEKLILELSSSELKTKQMKLSFRNKITPEINLVKRVTMMHFTLITTENSV